MTDGKKTQVLSSSTHIHDDRSLKGRRFCSCEISSCPYYNQGIPDFHFFPAFTCSMCSFSMCVICFDTYIRNESGGTSGLQFPRQMFVDSEAISFSSRKLSTEFVQSCYERVGHGAVDLDLYECFPDAVNVNLGCFFCNSGNFRFSIFPLHVWVCCGPVLNTIMTGGSNKHGAYCPDSINQHKVIKAAIAARTVSVQPELTYEGVFSSQVEETTEIVHASVVAEHNMAAWGSLVHYSRGPVAPEGMRFRVTVRNQGAAHRIFFALLSNRFTPAAPGERFCAEQLCLNTLTNAVNARSELTGDDEHIFCLPVVQLVGSFVAPPTLPRRQGKKPGLTSREGTEVQLEFLVAQNLWEKEHVIEAPTHVVFFSESILRVHCDAQHVPLTPKPKLEDQHVVRFRVALTAEAQSQVFCRGTTTFGRGMRISASAARPERELSLTPAVDEEHEYGRPLLAVSLLHSPLPLPAFCNVATMKSEIQVDLAHAVQTILSGRDVVLIGNIGSKITALNRILWTSTLSHLAVHTVPGFPCSGVLSNLGRAAGNYNSVLMGLVREATGTYHSFFSPAFALLRVRRRAIRGMLRRLGKGNDAGPAVSLFCETLIDLVAPSFSTRVTLPSGERVPAKFSSIHHRNLMVFLAAIEVELIVAEAVEVLLAVARGRMLTAKADNKHEAYMQEVWERSLKKSIRETTSTPSKNILLEKTPHREVCILSRASYESPMLVSRKIADTLATSGGVRVGDKVMAQNTRSGSVQFSVADPSKRRLFEEFSTISRVSSDAKHGVDTGGTTVVSLPLALRNSGIVPMEEVLNEATVMTFFGGSNKGVDASVSPTPAVAPRVVEPELEGEALVSSKSSGDDADFEESEEVESSTSEGTGSGTDQEDDVTVLEETAFSASADETEDSINSMEEKRGSEFDRNVEKNSRCLSVPLATGELQQRAESTLLCEEKEDGSVPEALWVSGGTRISAGIVSVTHTQSASRRTASANIVCSARSLVHLLCGGRTVSNAPPPVAPSREATPPVPSLSLQSEKSTVIRKSDTAPVSSDHAPAVEMCSINSLTSSVYLPSCLKTWAVCKSNSSSVSENGSICSICVQEAIETGARRFCAPLDSLGEVAVCFGSENARQRLLMRLRCRRRSDPRVAAALMPSAEDYSPLANCEDLVRRGRPSGQVILVHSLDSVDNGNLRTIIRLAKREYNTSLMPRFPSILTNSAKEEMSEAAHVYDVIKRSIMSTSRRRTVMLASVDNPAWFAARLPPPATLAMQGSGRAADLAQAPGVTVATVLAPLVIPHVSTPTNFYPWTAEVPVSSAELIMRFNGTPAAYATTNGDTQQERLREEARGRQELVDRYRRILLSWTERNRLMLRYALDLFDPSEQITTSNFVAGQVAVSRTTLREHIEKYAADAYNAYQRRDESEKKNGQHAPQMLIISDGGLRAFIEELTSNNMADLSADSVKISLKHPKLLRVLLETID